MKYRGMHRHIGKIDWGLDRPVIHAELHFAAYALVIVAFLFGR